MERVAILCFFGVLGVSGAVAQTPSDPIRVEVETVNVLVSVHQKATGEFLSGLSPEDFEVYEDGVRQEITNFSERTNLPLAIALCIDTSASVRIKLDFEKEAAKDFLYSVVRTTDRALLAEFDSGVTLLHDFTSNPNDLAREVDRLRAGGGTALYDAIYVVAEQKMIDIEGRKVMVILSDGSDLSSNFTFEDALRMAYRAEAAIYAISTTRFGAQIDHEGDNALKQLAESTGGRAYFPYSVSKLGKAFQDINEELRNQYSLAYVSTNKTHDGKFRKIRVKLKHDGAVTYYRKGYYAPTSEPAG